MPEQRVIFKRLTLVGRDSTSGYLGLQPSEHLATRPEPDGIRLVRDDPRKPRSARAIIGCVGYKGPVLSLEQMDPALCADAAAPPSTQSAP